MGPFDVIGGSAGHEGFDPVGGLAGADMVSESFDRLDSSTRLMAGASEGLSSVSDDLVAVAASAHGERVRSDEFNDSDVSSSRIGGGRFRSDRLDMEVGSSPKIGGDGTRSRPVPSPDSAKGRSSGGKEKGSHTTVVNVNIDSALVSTVTATGSPGDTIDVHASVLGSLLAALEGSRSV